MNEENKSKILIGTLVAVITLVIAVVGATYAFFSLNVSGDTTNTNVDIETGNADVVSIEQGVNNMHINLTVSDMAKDSPNKAYYATDTEENYKLSEEEGTLTFATITGTNKEASDCTAKVTITMDTSNDSMGKVLKKGDAILYITSGKTEETIDLYDLLSEEIPDSVTKEIEVELSVSESAEASITGYLKVNNTESDQSYLAGKTLNITITVDNLVCGGARGNAVAFITETSTSGTLESPEALQARNEEIEAEIAREKANSHIPQDTIIDLDTLRRFVGKYTKVTDNFICFGTSDTNTCKDNLDLYMYRIIGIDETNNQVKVIKATRIVKGTNVKFQWNSTNEDIKWSESDMYKYLNSSNVEDSYFKGNPNYMYLQEAKWENLIVKNPDWYYGDDLSSDPKVGEGEVSYTQERKEKLENGNPIGLMYLSDYLYAVETTGSSNWLYILNGLNGTSNTGTLTNGVLEDPAGVMEFVMTRGGHYNDRFYVRYIYDSVPPSGIVLLSDSYSIRPVFYLDGSKIVLGGKGTIEEPYYVTNVT